MESQSNHSNGGLPGKNVSPRLKEIEDNFVKNGGSFKEFRIGELFIGSNGDKDIQKQHVFPIKNNQDIPVISSGEYNLGVIGTTDLNAKIFPENTLTADMFGNVKFRDYPYKMVTHARVFSMKPLMPFNRCHGLFVQTHLSFLKKKFSYNNMCSWEKVKNEIITLPVHTDNRIAFDYMENFIRELEMEQIRELEMERIRELDAYLKVSGLNDTELTDEEKECLEKFERGEITYREFKIGELFEVQKVKTKLSKLDIKENSRVPVYSSDTTNSGIYGYSDTATFHVTDKFPCYLIFGDHTRTFNIARCDFAVMDNVKVLRPMKMLSDQALLYIATIWQKQIPNCGYSRHWKYASKCMIKLPFCNNHIDFDTMETFIKALEKLCIRSVVEWKDKIIETTKRVVG